MADLPAGYDLSLDVDGLSPDEAVAELIDNAAALEASDLFFATHEDHVGVAVRHLGVFRPVAVLRPDLARVYQPHQGQLEHRHCRASPSAGWPLVKTLSRHRQGRSDINTLPTLHGEDINVRLLVRQSRLLHLENLGLPHRDRNLMVDF